jgi:phytoene dehydrogenase-like protein
MTTGDYLSRFQDPLLRAILAAQWPDYGTPPGQSAFGIHATVAVDYFHGGFYPIGGAKEIASQATAAIEAHGGQCLVNHEVVRVLVRNGAAYGVVTRNKGEEIEFLAPKVISNAGAATTFGNLVPTEAAAPEREKLKRLVRGTSASILFLGLKDDPRQHGFDDANYWLYSGLDHDASARAQSGSSQITGAFVTFGSLRNPGQEPHVAQLICFGDEQPWQAYRDTQWQRRGEQYEADKGQLAEQMLGFAERHMPGLKDLVAYQELSTPLTIKSFTGHSGGAIYGQASDVNRLFRDQWSIDSSIRGLYLTGSDVGLPGINGALMGGAMVAAKLLGPFGLPRVMMLAQKNSR